MDPDCWMSEYNESQYESSILNSELETDCQESSNTTNSAPINTQNQLINQEVFNDSTINEAQSDSRTQVLA